LTKELAGPAIPAEIEALRDEAPLVEASEDEPSSTDTATTLLQLDCKIPLLGPYRGGEIFPKPESPGDCGASFEASVVVLVVDGIGVEGVMTLAAWI
jgi:hypothetical protein